MEESRKERLRMALRSGVGGYFPSQHYHRLPIPPAICPSLKELRLVLEISGPYKHEHLSLINPGGKSVGKDKPRRRMSSLAEQLRLSLSYSTVNNSHQQSNAVSLWLKRYSHQCVAAAGELWVTFVIPKYTSFRACICCASHCQKARTNENSDHTF